jgi:hypothetical protein
MLRYYDDFDVTSKEGLREWQKGASNLVTVNRTMMRILTDSATKLEPLKQAHSEAHRNGEDQMETAVKFPRLQPPEI